MSFNDNKLQMYSAYMDCFNVSICKADGKIIYQNFFGKVKIKSDTPIRLGFDQSSSQTGLAVKKSTGKFLCLIDFINTSQLPFELFKSMLGMKIEQIFSEVEVEICVVEKMWGGNKKSYSMLTALGDFITGYKYVLKGWSKSETAYILPNVWRSAYLAGEEYKGQYNKDKVKIAALHEGIKRYPQLREYGLYHNDGNHVNDSFDALGILEGYESKTFSSSGNGIRKVANTMEVKNHAFEYRIFEVSKGIDVADVIDGIPDRNLTEYEYNIDFTYMENIRRVTSVTNNVVYMKILSNTALISLMWEFNTVIDKRNDTYLVCWRKSVSKRL